MLLLVTVVHYIQVLSRSYFASKFWLKCFLDKGGVENPKQHKNIGFEQKLTIPNDKVPLPGGVLLLFNFQTFSSFFSYQFHTPAWDTRIARLLVEWVSARDRGAESELWTQNIGPFSIGLDMLDIQIIKFIYLELRDSPLAHFGTVTSSSLPSEPF